MSRLDYQIVVVDANPKRWPTASSLVRAGVPIAVAARWKTIRREMTVGLRKRVKEAVN